MPDLTPALAPVHQAQSALGDAASAIAAGDPAKAVADLNRAVDLIRWSKNVVDALKPTKKGDSP